MPHRRVGKGGLSAGARTTVGFAAPAADLAALADFVAQFSSKTIVVLGDFVADEFQYGEITRVSREAPVLILRHTQTKLVPGGGANAANNFVALGARVLPVTTVGDDAAGDALRGHFAVAGVDVGGILRVKGWSTPTKTRYLAGWAHTAAQQVLRVDREPATALPKATRAKLRIALTAKLQKADALAVSDYGFGVASPELARHGRAVRRGAFTITLDARHHLHSYARAGITSATPNEAEVEALHHVNIGNNLSELQRCGQATLRLMKLKSLLVTRGRDGMALFSSDAGVTHMGIHGGAQAVDVTGAGDTVLAAYTLALAAGAGALEAAHIANIAGGLVVMKRGTATVTQGELLEAIRREIVGDLTPAAALADGAAAAVETQSTKEHG